ncbi:hypothetical protein D3C87_1650010 [compost metagenome]
MFFGLGVNGDVVSQASAGHELVGAVCKPGNLGEGNLEVAREIREIVRAAQQPGPDVEHGHFTAQEYLFNGHFGSQLFSQRRGGLILLHHSIQRFQPFPDERMIQI